jgi:hypothetical protein
LRLFVWLVADGWCWFVLREKYCWLIVGGLFVLREKYCWLVADKHERVTDKRAEVSKDVFRFACINRAGQKYLKLLDARSLPVQT